LGNRAAASRSGCRERGGGGRAEENSQVELRGDKSEATVERGVRDPLVGRYHQCSMPWLWKQGLFEEKGADGRSLE